MNTPVIPARRRVGLTVSGAWLAAVLAIVAPLSLPFGRPGRPFLTIDGDLYALSVGGPHAWLLLVMLVATGAALGARERVLPPADRGDLLAVLHAGAYGFVMSSNYNGRLRPAEVLVEGDSFRVIRNRQTYEALLSDA